MRYEDNYKIDYGERDFLKGVYELFYKRWSPRSFRKVEIPNNVLEIIFDAVRWAPSCYNDQPWIFVSSSGKSDFDVFLNLLV